MTVCLLQAGPATWAGARAAGSKFVYLRNAAALLELALCSWALQRAAAAGFTPTTTPDLVRESLLEKCGFQPRGDTTQARPHAMRPATGACMIALTVERRGRCSPCMSRRRATPMGHNCTCCCSMVMSTKRNFIGQLIS